MTTFLDKQGKPAIQIDGNTVFIPLDDVLVHTNTPRSQAESYKALFSRLNMPRQAIKYKTNLDLNGKPTDTIRNGRMPSPSNYKPAFELLAAFFTQNQEANLIVPHPSKTFETTVLAYLDRQVNYTDFNQTELAPGTIATIDKVPVVVAKASKVLKDFQSTDESE